MRKITTDQLQAALMIDLQYFKSNNSEKYEPVMMSFVGSRGNVRGLLARAMIQGNIGDKNEDRFAFTIKDGDHRQSFKLPHSRYKTVMKQITNVSFEGRIINLDALANSDRSGCFIILPGPIVVPARETETNSQYQTRLESLFMDYVNCIGAGKTWNGDEWQPSLYKMYLALKVRLSLPVHVSWMPYLFGSLINREKRINDKPGFLIRNVQGYVSDELEAVLPENSEVERAAYRLNTSEDTLHEWSNAMRWNPNRAKWIKFDEPVNEVAVGE